MRQEPWRRARRPGPVLVLAALGVVLGGCACCGPRHYGDTELAVGYQPMGQQQPSAEYSRELDRRLWGPGR